MTLQDFHTLAQHMGATVAFTTSSTAVYQGESAGLTITVEVSLEALKDLTPVEAAAILADVALLSERLETRHGN